MDRFKVMLLEISGKLSRDDLAKLKFLCVNTIGKKKCEEISSGIQLFDCLIERTEIGPGDTEVLRTLLTNIGQNVLLELVDRYEGEPPSSDLPDPAELAKIELATEVIVEKLGRNWLKFGRKLGIGDGKLDGIREKHPRNLDEQVRELFKEWKKMRKSEAKVEDLIRALRVCDMNLTADVVEQKLPSSKMS